MHFNPLYFEASREHAYGDTSANLANVTLLSEKLILFYILILNVAK
jgi:hypothetical protein